ncbi:hypothetical protein K438DRAFT_1779815 [Mycena galopus ATCC 62051]|nr:hypothetical protein K438DRAFT_1779815 [Mycena galopus ATCC 62051]
MATYSYNIEERERKNGHQAEVGLREDGDASAQRSCARTGMRGVSSRTLGTTVASSVGCCEVGGAGKGRMTWAVRNSDVLGGHIHDLDGISRLLLWVDGSSAAYDRPPKPTITKGSTEYGNGVRKGARAGGSKYGYEYEHGSVLCGYGGKGVPIRDRTFEEEDLAEEVQGGVVKAPENHRRKLSDRWEGLSGAGWVGGK